MDACFAPTTSCYTSPEAFFRKKTRIDRRLLASVLQAASSQLLRLKRDHSATAAASAQRETTYKGTRSVPQALGGVCGRGSACRLQQGLSAAQRAARAQSDAYKTKEEGRQEQKQETTDTRNERRRRPAVGLTAQVHTSGSSGSGRGDALFHDKVVRRASSRGRGRSAVPREQWRRDWRAKNRRTGAGRFSRLGRAKNSIIPQR